MAARIRFRWPVIAAMLVGSCGNPSQPTQTAVQAPSITCPIAPAPATAPNGATAVVTYADPTVSGGTAPVTAACVPPSSSTFSIGSTSVTCTATDAVRRSASCSFAVTVTVPAPRLGVHTILAFGDSITEGEVPVAGEFGTFNIRPTYVELTKSYPATLTALLAGRYAAQGATRLDALTLLPNNVTDCTTDPPLPLTTGIVVINAGCLGENPQGSTALQRLNDKLNVYHPDLLLLLEGVNGLTTSGSIPLAVQAVSTLIGAGRSRGIPVLVGTLLPEIASGVNAGAAPFIVGFNAQLVSAATGAGAQVVDLYSYISADVTDWISPYDGLHPTEAGYQEVASVWFSTIQSTFEVQLGSTGRKLDSHPNRRSRYVRRSSSQCSQFPLLPSGL